MSIWHMEAEQMKKFNEVVGRTPYLAEGTYVVNGYSITPHETYGEVAILLTDKGKFSTTSRVIVDQLKLLEGEDIQEGIEVTVRKLRSKRGREYLMLT